MPSSLAHHTFEVSRTARVATLGAPRTADTWWVALHGYGQLAADFIRAFEPIVKPGRAVVAPEGLSRFYLDGMDEHERVGASWMTHEARDHEIDDYVRYLDATVRALRPDGGPPSIRVLGFSQGAATASRWALLGDTPVDRLVLWGGAPAHELDLEAHVDALRSMNLTIVAGTEDPYLTSERQEAALQRLRRYDIPATTKHFDGGHRLETTTLTSLVSSGGQP